MKNSSPIATHFKNADTVARTGLRFQRKLQVVLPAYNEEKDLGALIESVAAVMNEEGYPYQIIVVDDGSKDGTAEIARNYAKEFPLQLERHGVNQGLGATVRDGLRSAAAQSQDEDIIILMDADNTHNPGLIDRMVRLIREGNDVVIASRFQPGSRVIGVPYYRRVLSIVASWLFRIVLPIHGVRDFTCGYRAYRARVIRKAFELYGEDFVNRDGFESTVDTLLKLRKMGVIFCEVPFILRYDYKQGISKMKVVKTIVRTFGVMFRRRLGRIDR